MSAGSVAAAAVTVIAAGMAIAFIGILLPAVFLPGTWLILAGLIGCAAAGVLALVRPRAERTA